MHSQIEEGEIINYHSNSSGLPKTQLRSPEQPNSSCSSSLQSLVFYRITTLIERIRGKHSRKQEFIQEMQSLKY